MFFIMGISNGQKNFKFTQMIICKCCGKYGRYEAFMTYTYFSFFFIPLFKWSKHYYVKTSCCNTIYEISKEIGLKIERDEMTEIMESDLKLVKGCMKYHNCPNCGFTTGEDFDFCPKCGSRLEL